MNDVETAERLLEKMHAFQKEAMSVSLGYEQVIIAAGFAAYLTLWTQMGPHLSRAAFLVTGALIGVSLCLYVGFHILQTAVKSVSLLRLGKRLGEAQADINAQLAIFDEENAHSVKDGAIVLVVWPFVFAGAILTGFVGAAMLIGAAIATAIHGVL